MIRRNKKGQMILFGFMLAVAIIVLTMGIIGMLSQSNADAQSAMNCTSPALDKYTQAGCWVADLTLPYVIAIFIGIAGIVLGAKYLIGG